MAGHDLEAPAGDEPSHWEELYRARADEVMPYRPVFTGDVFRSVSVGPTGEHTSDVIVLQHPCALRTNGVDLNPSGVLVAEVRPYQYLKVSQWGGHTKRMPLPGVLPEGDDPGHRAAHFDALHVVTPDRLVERVCCMTPFGVNLLLQRWVNHNSRVIVPTFQYNEVISGVFEEADLVEEWCEDRADALGEDEAAAIRSAATEAVTWLREAPNGGKMRQELLRDPQQRSQIRKDMRAAIKALNSSAGPGTHRRTSAIPSRTGTAQRPTTS